MIFLKEGKPGATFQVSTDNGLNYKICQAGSYDYCMQSWTKGIFKAFPTLNNHSYLVNAPIADIGNGDGKGGFTLDSLMDWLTDNFFFKLGGGGISGTVTLSGSTVLDKKANNKVILIDSPTDVMLTMPPQAVGFSCIIKQVNEGKAIIAAAVGARHNNYDACDRSGGVGASFTLFFESASAFTTIGQMI
jgi:hypothetical protein